MLYKMLYINALIRISLLFIAFPQQREPPADKVSSQLGASYFRSPAVHCTELCSGRICHEEPEFSLGTPGAGT